MVAWSDMKQAVGRDEMKADLKVVWMAEWKDDKKAELMGYA